MNEFFDNELNQDEDEQKELAEKFKDMTAKGESVFFSSDDFLEIIDYFVLEEDTDNIILASEIAMKLYPDNIEIVLRRCQFIIDNCSNDNYLKTVEEVMSYAEPFDEEAAFIYKSLAMSLFEEDSFDQSLYFLRLSLAKNSNDNEVLDTFVISASRLQKKEKESTEFLEALVKANPYSANIWFSLALLSLLYGKYEKSLIYVDYSLALNNTDIEANRCKAEALLSTGKLDEGMALLEKIFQQEPENPQIFYSLGGAYEQKENWEKAIYFYKKAFEGDELNFSALMNIGLCYFSMNDFNTAKNYTERAINADPDNIYFKLSYANMLYEAGYKDDGEALYREIYADFDEKDLCAINWAMSIVTDGRLNDAINILNSTIDSCDIEDPNIYYTLIDLAATDAGYKEIIDHYLKVLSIKFNTNKEDLAKACPNLMKNNEYRNLITQYIK